MRKALLLLLALAATVAAPAQSWKPVTLNASYWGEMATHPGVKLGAQWMLASKGTTRTRRNSTEKALTHSLGLLGSVGMYHHRDYQTGLMVLPEATYTRQRPSGWLVAYGLGAGYLRTFIPKVYELGTDGEIHQVGAGYNHVLAQASITVGKDLSVKHGIPLDVIAKPQFLHALPNHGGGTSYFALEVGVRYHLPTLAP